MLNLSLRLSSARVGVLLMAGEKMREDQQQAVLFAAGTAALMACVERAVVVSLFVRWRVWAFLALNLLLLAIVFTSKSQIPSPETDQEDAADSKLLSRKKRRQQHRPLDSVSDGSEESTKGGECGATEWDSKNGGDDGMEETLDDQLSNEELNRRVEAFIAMFRQHLVSDQAKSKSLGLQRKTYSKPILVTSGQVN